MKINFILPSYGESGGLKVVYHYASEFVKRGHDVYLYYPLVPYNLGRENDRISFFLKRIKGFIIRSFHAIHKDKYNTLCYELYKAVPFITNYNVRKADVTIATAWPTAYSVSKLNREKGEKYYFIQDFELWDDPRMGLESYRLPLKKITISKWISEKLMSSGIQEEIPIIRNGIDKECFYAGKKHDNDIVCLMLYHDLEKKGVRYGIEAFKLAKAEYPTLTLKMFGLKTPECLDVDCEFYENPTEDIIASLYADSDIYIFPSLEEGWGLTVIEAMLSACVVVGTKTGCLLELGENEVNSLLSEPKDTLQMAENIVRACKDKTLRKKISCNAQLVSNEVDWDTSVDRFLSLLSSKT